jgi:hypothetical protein
MSGFRSEVDENCVLLGHYAASGGNSVPTFRDSLSVPSSKVKNQKKKARIPSAGLIEGRVWTVMSQQCGSARRGAAGGRRQEAGGRGSVVISGTVEEDVSGSEHF